MKSGRLAFCNIRVKELRRLLRSRGLTGPDPFVDEAMQAYGINPLMATAQECGKAFNLKLGERVDLKIRTISASDKSAEEIAAVYAEIKRARDRARAKRLRNETREIRKSAADFDVRAEAVWMVLHQTRFRSIADVATDLRRHKAFAPTRGQHLSKDALRQAIHRCIRDLNASCLIEIRQTRTRNKRIALRVRRRRKVVSLKSE